VLGPAASGKSAFAEDLLAAEPVVRYLATGPVPDPCDRDWTARVEVHRARRPGWWRTIEDPDAAVQLGLDGPPVLLDAVGTWLACALQQAGAWDGAGGWAGRLDAEEDRLLAAWRQLPARVVAVSEEVGWGVVPDTRSGRVFRDTLGRLNQRLAAQSERVVLVVAGRSVELSAAAGWA
jgi:adenosylcobinamide kinase/adenosylcobinamide-phosphate guanylyltransferase